MIEEKQQPRFSDALVKEILRNYGADKIKGLIDIQKQNGNYNYDELMYGMLIGMECAYYSLIEQEAKYTEKPEKWLKDSIQEDFKPKVAKGCEHWRCFVEVSDDGSKRSLICPDCNELIETLEGEAVSQEVLDQIDKSVQNFKEGKVFPIDTSS
jgi:hypothetical protein